MARPGIARSAAALQFAMDAQNAAGNLEFAKAVQGRTAAVGWVCTRIDPGFNEVEAIY